MRQLFRGESFKICLLVLVGFVNALSANWSKPIVIYPSSAPYSSTNPSLATDANGNSIAVWFDTSGSGSMLAATHTAGSLNGEGQPIWVLTNPIATSNVQAPTSNIAQSVGFDGYGTAIVAWTDGTQIYSSTLAPGQTTWSSPQSVYAGTAGNSIQNVNIAVSSVVPTSPPAYPYFANGGAAVTWTEIYSNGTMHLGTAFFNANTGGGWVKGVLVGDYVARSLVSSAAVDSHGNVIVAVSGATPKPSTVKAQLYRPFANEWVTSSTSNSFLTLYNSVAVDSSGNGTLVWVQQDGTLYSGRIGFVTVLPPFTDVPTSSPTLLSSSADPSTPPRCMVDQSGNVIALWTDQSGKIGSARYSPSLNSWTNLPLFDVGATTQNIALSGDSNGNSVASWTLLGTRNKIQTSSLLASTTSWGTPLDLSECPYNNDNSQISVTPTGNAIMVWQNNIDADTRGQILSSIFLSPFSKTE